MTFIDLRPQPHGRPGLTRADAEKTRAALHAAGGNRTQAARMLGITRGGLVQRLRRGVLDLLPSTGEAPIGNVQILVSLGDALGGLARVAAINAGLTLDEWIARSVRRELQTLRDASPRGEAPAEDSTR